MPPIEDQLEIIGRLALAALFGGIIGLERELRGYPAGIRTLALVTMGSLLFTDVSQLLGGTDRAAAGIATATGFLGAGFIFREGYTVRGITPSPTIWAAAAIGMAIGRQLYLVAAVGSILVFLVLEGRPFTRRVDGAVRRRTRELSEELEELITSSDMDDRERKRDEDD